MLTVLFDMAAPRGAREDRCVCMAAFPSFHQSPACFSLEAAQAELRTTPPYRNFEALRGSYGCHRAVRGVMLLIHPDKFVSTFGCARLDTSRSGVAHQLTLWFQNVSTTYCPS